MHDILDRPSENIFVCGFEGMLLKGWNKQVIILRLWWGAVVYRDILSRMTKSALRMQASEVTLEVLICNCRSGEPCLGLCA